ncbi:MAG: ABC-type transport auxiliary lipoprotein family protein [Terricaulis sp.]|nr:ABC-type transport auxiliary lipoprotein family protein [Terricaulis sp.]
MMRVTFLLPLLVLGGCITLLPEPPPPPRVFTLDAGDVARSESPRLSASLGVANPDGERAILGADLIWRTGQEIAYVGQTQWSGRADDALQSLLIETIARQGRFTGVTRSGEARNDFDIRWEVLDFEIDSQTMQARFRADVRLMASPGRRLIAQEIISAEAPVSDRSASVAAQALARAAREGGARIGVFASDAVAAELARRAASAD